MNITVLRGTQHIGGSIIKVSEGGKSILLDCGRMLPGVEQEKNEDNFDIAGIGEVSAVLLTHHHGDHSGFIDRVPEQLPIYATSGTIATLTAIGEYIGKPAKPMTELRLNVPVPIAEKFAVTAIPAEHSAHGSVMLLVESGGKRLLYTGDFKTLPDELPKGVDFLLTEGTLLTRDNQRFKTQDDVQTAFEQVMRDNPDAPIFILQSTANFGHIRSVIAARNAVCPKRKVMQDSFMKHLLTACGMGELVGKFAFTMRSFDQDSPRASDIIISGINEQKLLTSYKKVALLGSPIVFIRATMLNMLQKLKEKEMDFSKSTLIYAMWEGYKRGEQMKKLLDFFHAAGVNEQYIHTSGHADISEIARLVELTSPKVAACIHSEDASIFGTICSCAVKLDDGVEIAV